MADPAPTDCPLCGAPKLAKQISAAGFRLKGEGWYETDFKSDGKKNLAGDTPPVVASADPKGENKAAAVSKPEPKAESKPAAAPAPSAAPSSPST